MEKENLYRSSDSSPSPLTSISIAPKGRLIACGKMDSEILLLDSRSGKPKRGITGHTGAVTDVSFAGTSNAVLSCSWDQTTRLWNVKNVEDTLILKHPSEVKALAISLKLGKGASGSRDGMVKVFSLRSLKSIRNLQAHNSDISGIAIIDDDQKIVTASYDGTCRLWDLSSYDAEKTVIEQNDRIRSMTVVPDGSSVLLGYQNGTILQINIANVKEKFKMTGHTDIISALAVDPSGHYLASASWDRTIRIWSLENKSEVATGQLVAGIASLAWAPDGSILYSADLSGTVVSWTLSI
ncbi:MAG: WD40 repeat domain-containing protein [Candidatus Sifarchaeia archaeon]